MNKDFDEGIYDDILGRFKRFISSVSCAMIKKRQKQRAESVKYGRWVYWSGWCSNHDMRIDDAVCSECGYEHPTVRREQGDPRGMAAYQIILNRLNDKCPVCGASMIKE